jgi:hypothetical protein
MAEIDFDNRSAGVTHTTADAGASDAKADLAPDSERDRWLSAMADLSNQEERHYANLSRRMDKLERGRGMLSGMDSEIKTMLVLMAMGILVPIAVDLLMEVYRGWRQRLSS